MSQASRNQTKQLWGRDFPVVDKGLAEAQVVAFVEELMRQPSRIQKQHLDGLRESAKGTAMAADKRAEDLRERAKEDAKAERDRIISSAQAKAEEMLRDARKAALGFLDEETPKLLRQIEERFAAIEAEIRLEMELALASSRQKLLAVLQEEIRGICDSLLVRLGETASSVPPIREGVPEWAATIGQIPEVEQGLASHPEEDGLAALKDLYSLLERAPLEEEGAVPVAPVPHPGFSEAEGSLLGAGEAPLGIAEIPEATPAESKGGRPQLLEGEVDLIIYPPEELAQLINFQRRLRQTSRLRLIQTVGSWTEGMAITIQVKQPAPLRDILEQMPEVGKVEEGEKPLPWGQASKVLSAPGLGKASHKRMWITLKSGSDDQATPPGAS